MTRPADSPARFMAISGSVRRNGTTAATLELAAEYLVARGAVFETIHLADRRIVPCRCGTCNSRSDPCPVDDDVGDIVLAMRQADALIYAAPVHGFGLSSLMQTFIERAGVGHLRFERPLTNKVGGAVVVGRRYSHEQVHAQLIHNVLLNRMILPGSGFPAAITAGGPSAVVQDVEGTSAMLAMLDRMHALALVLQRCPMPATGGLEVRVGSLS